MFCLKPISLWLTLIPPPNAKKCDYSANEVKTIEIMPMYIMTKW